MQNKQRLELADYEAENLARLQKTFSRKWEFIFMQAEAQAKYARNDSCHIGAVFQLLIIIIIKVKVHTLDIAPLRESSPQKCSGMARVLKGFHSFTCTSTCSSAIGMSHTCLCLPSYSWYSFTDPGGMEG